MNKLLIRISIIVIAGGAFYGGMKYEDHVVAQAAPANFRNLTPEQRQQRAAQFGAGAGRGGANGANGNFTVGEIISRDDKSITLKLRDGGSKIVFYSSSTSVQKNAPGSATDLTTGEQVSVMGSANSDGSVTAQNIQLRPNIPNSSPSPFPSN